MNNDSIAIDLSTNPKNSLLYFDNIIPLRLIMCSEDDRQQVWQYLLKEASTNDAMFRMMGNIIIINQPPIVENGIVRLLQPPETLEDCVCPKLNDDLHQLLKGNVGKMYIANAYSTAHSLIERYQYPIIYSSEYESVNNLFPLTNYETVSASLANLELIDTSNASWEMILEVRKDRESINKLRKLGRVLFKDYSGKDKSFIEDDIADCLEKYKNTVKEWRFKTLISSIKFMQVSAPTVISSLINAITNQPIETIISSGIFMTISSVSLRIAQEKHKLMQIEQNHPFSIVYDMQKKLNS